MVNNRYTPFDWLKDFGSLILLAICYGVVLVVAGVKRRGGVKVKKKHAICSELNTRCPWAKWNEQGSGRQACRRSKNLSCVKSPNPKRRRGAYLP